MSEKIVIPALISVILLTVFYFAMVAITDPRVEKCAKSSCSIPGNKPIYFYKENKCICGEVAK